MGFEDPDGNDSETVGEQGIRDRGGRGNCLWSILSKAGLGVHRHGLRWKDEVEILAGGLHLVRSWLWLEGADLASSLSTRHRVRYAYGCMAGRLGPGFSFGAAFGALAVGLWLSFYTSPGP